MNDEERIDRAAGELALAIHDSIATTMVSLLSPVVKLQAGEPQPDDSTRAAQALKEAIAKALRAARRSEGNK